MPESGDTEPSGGNSEAGGTQGDNTPTTVSIDELNSLKSKYDKRLANESKLRDKLESRVAELEAELESKSEGKTDEELLELKRKLKAETRKLDADRREIVEEKRQFSAKQFSAEYGVDESELLDFTSPLEMELYALKHQRQKDNKTKPAPPAGSYDRPTGSASPPPGSATLQALAKKDTKNMTRAEQQEHLRKLQQGLSSL